MLLGSIATLGTLVLGATPETSPATRPVVPLTIAHAHNDYEHARPLLDALDHGFCSVEADVFLIDGQLRVAHIKLATRPGRTLQSLYLDPLRDRVKANGGRVYPGGPTVNLLVDFKTPGEPTWVAVRDALKDYASILTSWENGKRKEGAVTVVLTGDYPRAAVAGDGTGVRYAACDGKLSDLDAAAPPPADLVPLVSADWKKTFTWRGAGPLPEADRTKLAGFVKKAHEQGRTVRFWGAPDQKTAWTELRDAGADWINSDDLDGVQKFLTGTTK